MTTHLMTFGAGMAVGMVLISAPAAVFGLTEWLHPQPPAVIAAAPEAITLTQAEPMETPSIEELIAALPAGIRGDITLPGAPAAPAPRPSRPRPERDEIAALINGGL